MGEFHVEIVRIGDIKKHPNADTLSITEVHGGYPVIFRTGDFQKGDLATYVPVDALVPVSHPYFKFLDDDRSEYAQIRAKRLRKVFSMGLLVPAPDGTKEGDDVQALLGIQKFVPAAEREEPVKTFKNHLKINRRRLYERKLWRQFIIVASLSTIAILVAGVPPLYWFGYLTIVTVLFDLGLMYDRKRDKKPKIPEYDIEGLRRYKRALKEGELVIVTEKIHGCNARYVFEKKPFRKGKFHVGSRTIFPEYTVGNKWWRINFHYDLEQICRNNPNKVIFGEIYGSECQDLNYGKKLDFVVFDVQDLKTGQFLEHRELRLFCLFNRLPMAPVLYSGPWSEEVAQMSEGKTMMGADHVREGIVIRPIKERHTPALGRTILKLPGQGYLLRKST